MQKIFYTYELFIFILNDPRAFVKVNYKSDLNPRDRFAKMTWFFMKTLIRATSLLRIPGLGNSRSELINFTNWARKNTLKRVFSTIDYNNE